MPLEMRKDAKQGLQATARCFVSHSAGTVSASALWDALLRVDCMGAAPHRLLRLRDGIIIAGDPSGYAHQIQVL